MVTVSHTAGVYLLGAVTLYASRYVVPERLYPWLGAASGILIALLGLSLLYRRLVDSAGEGGNPLDHGHAHEGSRPSDHEAAHARGLAHGHDHGDGHHHHHVPKARSRSGRWSRSACPEGSCLAPRRWSCS